MNGGRTVAHRFGCSGIDGVTFAPRFGSGEEGDWLYVAYGIYGDTLRTDNDYQVLLAYDTKEWKRYEQPLSQSNLHKSGPAAPDRKYFVRTGNTSYGIQNLAYDPASGNLYAAVYKGKKPHYPNWSLFVIDGSKPARRESLQGFDTRPRARCSRWWRPETRTAASADGISNGVRRDCARWAAVISTFRKTPVRKRPASRAAPSVCTNGRAMPRLRSGRWSSISFPSGSGCRMLPLFPAAMAPLSAVPYAP